MHLRGGASPGLSIMAIGTHADGGRGPGQTARVAVLAFIVLVVLVVATTVPVALYSGSARSSCAALHAHANLTVSQQTATLAEMLQRQSASLESAVRELGSVAKLAEEMKSELAAVKQLAVALKADVLQVKTSASAASSSAQPLAAIQQELGSVSKSVAGLVTKAESSAEASSAVKAACGTAAANTDKAVKEAAKTLQGDLAAISKNVDALLAQKPAAAPADAGASAASLKEMQAALTSVSQNVERLLAGAGAAGAASVAAGTAAKLPASTAAADPVVKPDVAKPVVALVRARPVRGFAALTARRAWADGRGRGAVGSPAAAALPDGHVHACVCCTALR